MSMEGVLLSKKSIAIFGNKYCVLSIDMKTKVVQHVPRINLGYFKFQMFKFFQIFNFFQIFKFSLVPSFCLTFRHFLIAFSLTIPVFKCNLSEFSYLDKFCHFLPIVASLDAWKKPIRSSVSTFAIGYNLPKIAQKYTFRPILQIY